MPSLLREFGTCSLRSCARSRIRADGAGADANTTPESMTVPIETLTTRRTASSNAASMPARPPLLRTVGRGRWLRLYPIALGLGGLGGSWRTAAGLGAPLWPAMCLVVLCFGAWITITALYVVAGGGDPRALIADLRHADQGFAVGYIPVIPLLLLAQVRAQTSGLRILDLGVVAVWAIVTAALVAHWITTPRDRHAIHPGLSLPVVAGPFISCISLQANSWHLLAQGMFAVGVFFWMTFGTVILGRLMTEQRLPDARFSTLAALMVPPATGQRCLVRLERQPNHHAGHRLGCGAGDDGADPALHRSRVSSPAVHGFGADVQLPVGSGGEHGWPLGHRGTASGGPRARVVESGARHGDDWPARSPHRAHAMADKSGRHDAVGAVAGLRCWGACRLTRSAAQTITCFRRRKVRT